MHAIANPTSAFSDIHDLLICWGLTMLRGGNGPRQSWDSDENIEKQPFTAAQHDAAKALHSRVIRLPEISQRLLLQVHYRELHASYWDTLSQSRKAQIVTELAREVNWRIQKYNAQAGIPFRQINERDYDSIRERAIRSLDVE